ncbi:CHC2 zinc finger domain-containing protein [Bacillus subtilis]|uniref:CHC2 zinc finger domain-containing protein n=1 Tax=Bacillus subtilis TaxID=1423 RepID=UPI003EF3ADAF
MFVDYVVGFLGDPRWNLAETEAQWCCPFCTDTRYRFRINADTLQAYCFNCQWKGNAVKFVADYQKLNFHEALDIVNFYQDFRPLPEDIYEEVFDKLYDVEYEPEKTYISLPEDFKRLDYTKSYMAKRYFKYAYKRGLTDKQISIHGAGFCPEGKIVTKTKSGEEKQSFLRNRLILQAYNDEGEPIYWNARAILDNIVPKSYNPTGGIRTINKSDVIFNFNNAKKKGACVITEGIFDATTVGSLGVSIFGKTLSTKQLLQLVQADLEAVYIMLDPDALEDAIKMATMVSKHISNTYICYLKGGDPNEVGRKGCLRAIKEAEKFDNYTAIKYKFLH